MYTVCTCRRNRKWKRKSRQSWGNKSTYTDSADILLCFFLCTSWCRILYKFYSTLFKEAATKQRQTNFEHTFNLSKSDTTTLQSQFWETSHKTYQWLLCSLPESQSQGNWTPLKFRCFQMHLEIPLPPKVIDIPLESITFPADLHWGVILENDHEVAAETDSWNTRSAIGFLQRYFRFLPERGP